MRLSSSLHLKKRVCDPPIDTKTPQENAAAEEMIRGEGTFTIVPGIGLSGAGIWGVVSSYDNSD